LEDAPWFDYTLVAEALAKQALTVREIAGSKVRVDRHDKVSRGAVRESGLIHLSDGWDDALNLILFVNRLLIMVKPGARILDFGCGAGRMVFRLRELSFDAYGFDVHDYVAYRTDNDRHWFRFSQSTASNTSAFTINADSYAIPVRGRLFRRRPLNDCP
jgi:hypothetical protein